MEATVPTSSVPIPLDLRKELPDPMIPWSISPRIFEDMQAQAGGKLYKKCQVLPEDKEWRFVWRYFHHEKPTRYSIKRIYAIHERHQMQAFELNLSSIEREAPTFTPTWNQEPRSSQRAETIKRWQQAVQPFSPFHTKESDGRRRTWNNTKILPLWHGTSEGICDSICKSGFVYFGKKSLGGKADDDPSSTDEGFFGSGIYFTNSARYTSDIYSEGHVLLAWVSMREPFPVVGDPKQLDMKTLKGQGAYKHYNAHYVPVVPNESGDPDCAIYYPCQEGQEPTYDEIVVFQKAQALPRFWIELEVDLPYMIAPSDVPQFVNEFIPHLFKLLQNTNVDRDQKLRNILGKELGILLKLQEDDDLTSAQQAFYHQLTNLIESAGTINKAIRNTLTGAVQSPPSPTPPKVALTLHAPPPKNSALPAIVFGKAEWTKYFGDIGVEPPLPPNIDEILSAKCDFWPAKQRRETCMLTLIPATIDGKQFTLNLLEKLIQTSKTGHKKQFGRYNSDIKKELGDKSIPISYWCLMTRDVIPDSQRKAYDDQKKLVQGIAKDKKHPYELPKALEAATSILMEHVRNGNRLYSYKSRSCTRCQEKVNKNKWPTAIGGFDAGGFFANVNWDDNFSGGVGAVWKFF